MTDENETETETLSTEDEFGAESVEDSARAVMEELGLSEDAIEAKPEAAAEEPAEAKPDPVSEAARTLAKSKRGKGGKFVKAEDAITPAAATDVSTAPSRVDPPARLSVSDKEAFLKLDPAIQKPFRQAFEQLDSNFTKKFQDLANERKRVDSVNAIYDHYRERWHQRGFTQEQATAEAFATAEAIREKPIPTISNFIRITGVTLEDIARHLSGDGGQPTAAAQTQQKSLTEEDINRILATREQQSQTQTEVQAATQGYDAVRNEVAANGTYLYPELWDTNGVGYWNAPYLQRVQPLVDSLRKTQPGLAWGPALKQAVNALRVLDGKPPVPQQTTPGSPSPTGSRLTREQDIQNARHASGSVRSRGNGLIPSTSQASERETYEDSARAALAMFNSNSH